MATRIVLLLVACAIAITIGIAVAQKAGSGIAEVRISARQLDDGRTEFALQQRVGREWAERILPLSRMFPANAPLGRWLNSSPLFVNAGGTFGASDGSDVSILESTDGVIQYDGGRIVNWVGLVEDETGSKYLWSDLAIRIADPLPVAGADLPLPEIWFVVSCVDGERRIAIQYVRLEPAFGRGYRFPFYQVEYWVYGEGGGGSLTYWEEDLVWSASERERDAWWGTRTVNVRRDARFYMHIRDAIIVDIELIGNGTSETLTVPLDGAWDTPVQPNLDRCGDYYAGQGDGY